eukprot:gene32930-17821_t
MAARLLAAAGAARGATGREGGGATGATVSAPTCGLRAAQRRVAVGWAGGDDGARSRAAER